MSPRRFRVISWHISLGRTSGVFAAVGCPSYHRKTSVDKIFSIPSAQRARRTSAALARPAPAHPTRRRYSHRTWRVVLTRIPACTGANLAVSGQEYLDIVTETHTAVRDLGCSGASKSPAEFSPHWHQFIAGYMRRITDAKIINIQDGLSEKPIGVICWNFYRQS